LIHMRDAPNGWKNNPRYLYIGRPTKWANPFAMKNNTKRERDRVLTYYRAWFRDQVFLFRAIAEGELDNKILVCFCKPEPCHGDLLVTLANGSSPTMTVPDTRH